MTYESSVMAVKMFEFSSKEELFSFNANIDCPYCTKPVTASQHHLSTHHLRCAIHYSENGIGKFSIPCFCPEERRGKRSHWHCTKCTKIIQRSSDFRLHLSNHGMVMTDKPQDGEETSMDNTYVSDTPEERPPCQKCDSLFATPPNFRQQSKQQNGKHEQPMLCVDAKNGIYVTPKDSEGTSIPIHICKSLVAQSFLCELDSCREFMSMAAQSGNPGKECFHLERTKNARCYSPPPPLCNASLEEMAEKGILSKSRKDECMALVSRAFMEEVDCVFPVFWEENGPERFVYFSVFADQNEVWCTFGRTCVTLDTKFGKWHCQCPDANNAQYSCIHQHLCMWWVFQERPCWRQSATVNRMVEMEGIPAKIMKTDDIL
ncbi:uncharacterized protein LOC103037290 isoform X1 [Astyanax mexicanus]|uniref:uncharacterized protein LOC103037290 isoform X1 n=1 Tax=Astyanax mexicanus TaxID=7994 RepID=UPI000BBDF999|nr:uncharacterized protein LOC103037290 isoform X1 [Astyanax mexicanus]